MTDTPAETARNDQQTAESRNIALRVAAFYDGLPKSMGTAFRQQLTIEYLSGLMGRGEDA